jgi:hypothetical protein
MREPRPASRLVLGVDGMKYGSEIDAEIDGLLDGCFSGGSGPRAMAYLESITIRRVLGPDASDQHLRHLEGARWLVGVIRERIANFKRAQEADNERHERSG